MGTPERNLPVEADVRVVREYLDDPQPGEYWRVAKPCGPDRNPEQVPVGTLVLVTDVHLVEDDALHSVETRLPPPFSTGSDAYRLTFLEREFYRHFERTEQAEARRAVEAQMAGYVSDFESASRRIEAHVAGLARLQAPDAPDEGDASGTALAEIRDRRAEAAARAERLATEVAEATERTQSLVAASGSQIAEQIKAAMRRPKRMLDKIERGLTRMAAYCGENVVIEQVADGAPAPEPGPLTVYQATRYMDEEYLVHLAEGGADSEDWDDFGRHLYQNPATLDRIIPAPVGICMMRYRREKRVYNTGDGIDALYENAARNAPNFERFLLFRDGARVWAIRSDVTNERVGRLFPTGDDLERPFERGGRRITRDDYAYSRAFTEQEQARYAYRLLVLVLWGIHDREGMFRVVPAGRKLPDCVGDPGVFRWVHDDEALLEDKSRDDLVTYLKRHRNDPLVSGSRVLCNWRLLVNKATAPGLIRRYSWRKDVNGGLGVAVARRDGDEFVVRLPVVAESWDDRETRFEARVSLTPKSIYERGGFDRGLPFIVVDAVRLEDVEHYMTSRETRRSYLDYYETFVELRDVLRADRREQADMRAAVADAFRGRGVATDEPWRNALRAWRAARRGRQVPAHGDADFDRVRDALVAEIEAQVAQETGPDGRPSVLADLRADDAGEPFALARSGRGRLVTYHPHEGAPFGPAPFSLRRQWLPAAGGAWRLEREGPARHTDPLPPTETALWTAPDAPRGTPNDGSSYDLIGPDRWDRLRRLLDDRSGVELLNGKLSDDDLLPLMRTVARREFDRSRSFRRAELVVPVGSRYTASSSGMAHVMLTVVALPFLGHAYHRLLTPEGRDSFAAYWRTLFRRPPAPHEGEATLYALGAEHVAAAPTVSDSPLILYEHGWSWECGRAALSAMPAVTGDPSDIHPADDGTRGDRWNPTFPEQLLPNRYDDYEWDPAYDRAERWAEVADALRTTLKNTDEENANP